MTREFTLNLIEEYLKDETPENIEFEQSLLQTLIQIQEYDLLVYCLEKGFNTDKLLENILRYVPLEWLKDNIKEMKADNREFNFADFHNYTLTCHIEFNFHLFPDLTFAALISNVFVWTQNNREVAIYLMKRLLMECFDRIFIPTNPLNPDWDSNRPTLHRVVIAADMIMRYMTKEDIEVFIPAKIDLTVQYLYGAILNDRSDVIMYYIDRINPLYFGIFLESYSRIGKDLLKFIIKYFTQNRRDRLTSCIVDMTPGEVENALEGCLPDDVSYETSNFNGSHLSFRFRLKDKDIM